MNIIIKTDVFAAVSVFRAIDDVRYYINGIYLETGTNGARLVATDGHQMAVAKIDGSFPESTIILPNSLIAAVKSKPKAPQQVMLEFKEGHREYTKQGNVERVFLARDITLTFGEITTSAKEIDGTFPNYRRSVPSEVDGTPTQFDPRLIGRIDKACSTLGYKSFVGIAYNGDRSALSVIDDNFVVVTMPFRAEPSKFSPAWIQELLSQSEDVRRAA
jgi:DNA polymerase-3 subunit beta